MKIDIDTNNLAALERLEAELDVGLGTVRFAIQRLKERGSSVPRAPRTQKAGQNGSTPAVAPRIAQAFDHTLDALPNEFTTNELMDSTSAGKVAIRKALKAAVVAGRLQMIEPNSGRRPAKYRKTNA